MVPFKFYTLRDVLYHTFTPAVDSQPFSSDPEIWGCLVVIGGFFMFNVLSKCMIWSGELWHSVLQCILKVQFPVLRATRTSLWEVVWIFPQKSLPILGASWLISFLVCPAACKRAEVWRSVAPFRAWIYQALGMRHMILTCWNVYGVIYCTPKWTLREWMEEFNSRIMCAMSTQTDGARPIKSGKQECQYHIPLWTKVETRMLWSFCIDTFRARSHYAIFCILYAMFPKHSFKAIKWPIFDFFFWYELMLAALISRNLSLNLSAIGRSTRIHMTPTYLC